MLVMKADYYRGSQGEDYEVPSRRGYTSINVLEFLTGLPWDDFALCWVHSLRPSSIRVTADWETTDACCWRVTVYVGKDGRIKRIRQEVEVGLGDQYEHGHALGLELSRRKGVAL